MIPCGDIHQSFSGTLVKFVDNFPMFADTVLVFFLFTALPKD